MEALEKGAGVLKLAGLMPAGGCTGENGGQPRIVLAQGWCRRSYRSGPAGY